jgi:hypothetical protein
LDRETLRIPTKQLQKKTRRNHQMLCIKLLQTILDKLTIILVKTKSDLPSSLTNKTKRKRKKPSSKGNSYNKTTKEWEMKCFLLNTIRAKMKWVLNK